MTAKPNELPSRTLARAETMAQLDLTDSMSAISANLRVSDLSTGYRARPVIRHLTLPEIRPGELHSLIGPNAAGKSTLLRALAGLLPATGSIMLGDKPLLGLKLEEHARYVTYMPQSIPQGIALSVLETVRSALRASPVERTAPGSREATRRAADVLVDIGIASLAMEPLDRLSGGQRQLVSLAQALVRAPRVLLLDEPISALDLQHQLRVMQLVRRLAVERRMIVLTVLHDLQVAARWSDGIIVLSEGHLAAAGTPEEAITPAVLASVYGVQARVERWADGALQIIVDDLAAGQR